MSSRAIDTPKNVAEVVRYQDRSRQRSQDDATLDTMDGLQCKRGAGAGGESYFLAGSQASRTARSRQSKGNAKGGDDGLKVVLGSTSDRGHTNSRCS